MAIGGCAFLTGSEIETLFYVGEKLDNVFFWGGGEEGKPVRDQECKLLPSGQALAEIVHKLPERRRAVIFSNCQRTTGFLKVCAAR